MYYGAVFEAKKEIPDNNLQKHPKRMTSSASERFAHPPPAAEVESFLTIWYRFRDQEGNSGLGTTTNGEDTPAFSKSPNPHLTRKYALYAVTALIVMTGSWISLGKFQQNQTADSIVPVLVSLQHWKPFFWETNRYGMLVPLLAIPCRNPLVNLIFQSIVGTCAGVTCSFLLVQ